MHHRVPPLERLESRLLLAANVVVNEIMYHASSQNVGDEWVELFNRGASTVDLSGWHFGKGIDYTFAPGTSLPAGGYLVVAHDLASFNAKYPSVSNVVGGWNGQLGNNGDTIELDDATGTIENSVSYGTNGDWAVREHGRGVQLVSTITRSGSIATVTIPEHKYNNGDQIQIFGAAQPEYNGTFTVGGVTNNTFTITVSGTPASPATPATPNGTILSRQLTDLTHSGLSYFAAHDGLGKSLELINPALPNDSGENWTASTANQGTPGAANSVLSANVAPLILDLRQTPIVPKSTDTVTITARMLDELGNAQSATLFYRVDAAGPPPFTAVSMHDDGLNGDVLAGDGIWTARIPPQANNAVIEYYLSATDGTHARTWPAPLSDATQSANALYQVDDSAAYTGNQPVFKLIMKDVDRQELAAIGSPVSTTQFSNAAFNGAFVSIDSTGAEQRLQVAFRNRGGGSRDALPNNRRVELNNSAAERWHGARALNFNGMYSMEDVLGSAVSRFLGLQAQVATPVQVRINNVNEASGSSLDMFGSYSWVESEDGDMVSAHFPTDSAGNYYRGTDPGHNSNLGYLGTNPVSYYGLYPKQNNHEANDYTDIISLIKALDPGQTPDANFVNVISQNLNISQALLYFAVNSVIGNEETALGTGYGDDFALYRGVIDPRFQIIAHDLDTVLGRGDSPAKININESLFTATALATVKRLLTNPAFAPLYFKALRDLATGAFSAAQIFPVIDQTIASYVPADVINSIKAFITGRNNFILTTIPTSLTVASPLAVSNGYPSISGTTPTITTTLSGVSDVTQTYTVLVNGVAVTYTAVPSATPTTGPYGAWSAASVTLNPGLNRVLVQAMDANGKEIARQTIDIYYNRTTGGTTIAAGNVSGTWSAANGPYTVTGSITVPIGQTLTIQPGVTVFFSTGAGILVNGTLNAQGTDAQHIRFTRVPGAATTWKGLDFENTVNDNRLAYVDMEYGDAGFYAPSQGSTPNVMVNNSRISIDHMTWAGTIKQLVNLINSSIKMTNSVTPNISGAEPIHFHQMPASGFAIFDGNTFGTTTGFNDIIDLTGGKRPGPIAQFLNNVFLGNAPAGQPGDDLLDLDGTDAYIEGNIFMNVSNFAANDTNSAISGGNDASFGSTTVSNLTAVRNIFINVDHAYLSKQGNFLTAVNNTYVNVGTNVYNFNEPGLVAGRGAYIDGDIIYGLAPGATIIGNFTAALQLAINHSLLPVAPQASISQVGNVISTDPRFVAGTNAAALVNATLADIRAGLMLRPGSLAIGLGPNGRDAGAAVPAGASISGEPISPTANPTATLNIDGPDILSYRYRINGGAWSGEISTTGVSTTSPAVPAIQLSGLSPGTYTVQVEARNYAGVLQADSAATTSRTWTVTAAPTILINEVLAQNDAAVNHNGTFPDVIELYNNGPATVDLGDMSITDDPAVPRKFIFAPGTTIASGGYLVLYADNPNATPGIHVGFGLKQSGEGVYLYNTIAAGSARLDGITFGQQLSDRSIGRLSNGTWGLTIPTFGSANVAQLTGDPSTLKINEWLAAGVAPLNNDFIELYNPDPLPVSLGGLSLTDQTLGWPGESPIAALSFIAGAGFSTFIADGASGADHVNFKLSHDRGEIGLFDASLNRIDSVIYQLQKLATSQGRSPNGDNSANAYSFFAQPNPGVSNPSVPTTVQTLTNYTDAWKYYQAGTLAAGWQTPGFVDTSWSSGNGLLYVTAANLPQPKNTALTLGQTTYYFRRHFTFTGNPATATLQLNTILDDGAIVYLNGVEVLRVGMPSGAVTGSTLANRLISPENATYDGPFNVPAGALVNGDNVIAVEVHQQNAGSSDIVFGLWAQALVAATAPPAPPLRITEISYNPEVDLPAGSPYTSDDFEFIELKNIGTSPLNLFNYQFTAGIIFSFPSVTLQPGADIVVVKNQAAFTQAFGTGIPIAGQYTDALSNTGEEIRLVDSAGNVIHDFIYSDAWYPTTDGGGDSLVINNPIVADLTTWGSAASWHASTFVLGTPGLDELAIVPAPGAIIINELLSHSPLAGGDWIEFKNTTGTDVNIGGWYLSDSASNLLKYQIPANTFVPANGYLVLDESTSFGPAFGFSEDGDQAYLSASASAGILSGFRAGVSFGAAESTVPFGRYTTSTGRVDFVAMSAPTPGAANAYPKVGPIVISELMYHGSGSADEFIELHNITNGDVPLYDPLNPADTWQFTAGITFAFPQGTSIAAGAYALVVPIDPETFRAKYGIPADVQIFGPYTGALNNTGEDVELSKPNDLELGHALSYIRVDDVNYGSIAPWPTAPNGTGPSLARINLAAYGNDVINWTTGTIGGTPGAANMPAQVLDHHIFYNNSYWDNPAKGFTDDNAIDPTKTALLPGGTGSFANYTGSSLGINGIMIDVTGLTVDTLSTADFTFMIGNSSDLTTWTQATDPSSISILHGHGIGGSDRIELIWSDNAIQNTWLQVTVLADAATGLASPHVFYYGNSIGETGDNLNNTFVNAGDFIAVRDHPSNFPNHAPPSNPYDLNHDSFVNAGDLIIARDHGNNFQTALKFIAPLAAPAAAPAATVVKTSSSSSSVSTATVSSIGAIQPAKSSAGTIPAPATGSLVTAPAKNPPRQPRRRPPVFSTRASLWP